MSDQIIGYIVISNGNAQKAEDRPSQDWLNYHDGAEIVPVTDREVWNLSLDDLAARYVTKPVQPPIVELRSEPPINPAVQAVITRAAEAAEALGCGTEEMLARWFLQAAQGVSAGYIRALPPEKATLRLDNRSAAPIS